MNVPNRLMNYAICGISGALAGVVVAAFSIGVELGLEIWSTPWSIYDFFSMKSAWERAWQCVDFRFVEVPILGAIAGLLSGLFSRSTRRPVVLASVWASIVGTVFLVLFALISLTGADPGQPAQILVMMGVYLALGAAFGFCLGVISHCIEKKLQPPTSRAPSITG